MIVNVKGGQIFNWSDVIDQRLRSLTPGGTEKVQDRLILSVSTPMYSIGLKPQIDPPTGL